MSEIVNRIARRYLLSGARWKEEGWERPTPYDRLERAYKAPGRKMVHFSDVGPGFEQGERRDDIGGEGGTQPAGGFKVGVNPNTTYSTPVGVYGYPLNRKTYSDWFSEDRNGKPPFAAQRDWMYVLRVRDPVLLNKNATSRNFGERELREAARTIAEKRPRLVNDASNGQRPLMDGTNADLFNETAWWEAGLEQAKYQTPFVQLWMLTRMLMKQRNSPALWTKLLVRDAGVEAVFDRGSETLHENEPYQGVILRPGAFEVVDVVQNAYAWEIDRRQSQRELEFHKTLQRFDVSPSLYGHLDLQKHLAWSRRKSKAEKLEDFFEALSEEPKATELLQSSEPLSGGAVSGKSGSFKFDKFEFEKLTFDGTYSAFARFPHCRFKNCRFEEQESHEWASFSDPKRFVGCTFVLDSMRFIGRGVDRDDLIEYARRAMAGNVQDKVDTMYEKGEAKSEALAEILKEHLDIGTGSPKMVWMDFHNCTLEVL